jgi:methylmalonyl-CoA mutase cobalamin-binding domain/chain
MIATKPKDLINPENNLKKFTHCEIHPSTMFGVLASCIPFPEHNQSPRNTYQCAQGKQAMGVYVTNYENRMDKTAYILNYPMRPLVETRIMDLINLNKIPSGSQLIVAIMTHTGYNQEDSLLINKGSVDRGMALVTVYHTEKDEDKQKINGDEEIRCKPDPTKTKGLKMGNYNKVNSKGVIPENTLVENRDMIITKVVPIKENRNDLNVQKALDNITHCAQANEGNLLELAVVAARERATLGEISYAMEKVFVGFSASNKTITGVYAKEINMDAKFKEAKSLSDQFAEIDGRRPRIMIAKLGQDGHDRGAKIIATCFADLGFDVDMGPLFQTPAEAARQAAENDVHILGISSLAAGHKTLVPETIAALAEIGREDIMIIVGGVIPAQDYPYLFDAGVAAVFGPGTIISEAASEILKIMIAKA